MVWSILVQTDHVRLNVESYNLLLTQRASNNNLTCPMGQLKIIWRQEDAHYTLYSPLGQQKIRWQTEDAHYTLNGHLVQLNILWRTKALPYLVVAAYGHNLIKSLDSKGCIRPPRRR